MSPTLAGRLAKIVKAERKAKIYFGHFFSLGRGKTCFPDVEDEASAVCNTGFAEPFGQAASNGARSNW